MNSSLKLLSFAILICCSLGLKAQEAPVYELRGVVRDAKTWETLPFANIFFSGTTYGTVSDKDGNFVLKADAPGTYELIISFTGYRFYRKQINLNQAGSVVITAPMETTARDLGAVTIVAKKDAKWKKRLKEFKFIFLGGTRNSPSCKILNEDILYFEEDEATGVFEAYASEPLVIENQALGYRLTYALEDFKIFYKENYSEFHGYPSFQDMSQEGEVKRKWLNSRDKAYKGSVKHFFRELYAGSTREAGFRVRRAQMIDETLQIEGEEFDVNLLVNLSEDGIRKELAFSDYLYIAYELERVEEGYLRLLPAGSSDEVRNSGKQISWLKMPTGTSKAIFERSGFWVNSRDFLLEGYWSYEKIADLLPSNYQPAKMNDK